MLAILSSSRPSQSGRPSLRRTIIVNFTMVEAARPARSISLSPLLFFELGISIFPFGNLFFPLTEDFCENPNFDFLHESRKSVLLSGGGAD